MNSKNNILLFLLAFGIFGILNTEMGVIGILPVIEKMFNVSIQRAGYLVSVFSFTVAISGIIMPLLFSNIDKKKVMLISIGMFIVSNIVSAFSTNFNVVLLCRVLPAIFHPIFISMSFTIAAGFVDKKDMPKTAAVLIMGMSAGMAIGVPISNLISNLYSYKAVMMYSALINAISFLGIIIFMPSVEISEKVSYSKQIFTLKKPIAWISLITALLIQASASSVYSYFAGYIGLIPNISDLNSAIMLFIFGISSVLGNFLAGRLLTKYTFKFITVYIFVFISVYLLMFLFKEFLIFMFILSSIFGILFGMGINIQQYIIVYSMQEAPEFANGLVVSFGNMGIVAGTFIGGIIIQSFGLNNIAICGIAFLMLSLLSTILRIIVGLHIDSRVNSNVIIKL